jgi:hypothetical protein
MNTNTQDSKKQHCTSFELIKELAKRVDLYASELRVYQFIAACCGLSPSSNKWCWYSHKQIAEAVGAHRVAVTSAIKVLVSKKMIAEDSETQRAKNVQVKSYCLTHPKNWEPVEKLRVKKGTQPVVHKLQVDNKIEGVTCSTHATGESPTGSTHATGTCSTHATGLLTYKEKENNKIKLRKEEIPPDALSDPQSTPPEDCENSEAQAPLYEPDGSHDTSLDFDIDYSYDYGDIEDNSNEQTNSDSSTTDNATSTPNNIEHNMEVSMDEKPSPTENHVNSPISDSSESALAVISKTPETLLTADARREIALSLHGESALRKPRANKYRYFPQHMELARDWAEFGTYEMPSLKVNLEAWANEIRLIEENDKFSTDTLRDMLEFVIKDSFWKPNALSVMGLRKEGKNGMRKLENIKNAMRNSRSFKEKKSAEALNSDEFGIEQPHRFSFERTIEDDEIPF